MKSLTKGALGDCSKRFPIVAKIAMWILARPVNKLIEQTRAHELNSRELVRRCEPRQLNCQTYKVILNEPPAGASHVKPTAKTS